MASIKT